MLLFGGARRMAAGKYDRVARGWQRRISRIRAGRRYGPGRGRPRCLDHRLGPERPGGNAIDPAPSLFQLWPEVAESSRERPDFGRQPTLPPALRQLCDRLAGADDLRSGIEAVAWACDGVFPFYRVALAFPARKPRHLFVAAAWARDPSEELEGFDFSVRGHPLERALIHGCTVVRTHPSEDHADKTLLGLYAGEGKVEELGAPLELCGRRGLLIFASRQKGSFDEAARAWVEDARRIVSLWARSWAGPEAPQVLKEQYETVLEGSLDGIAVQQRGTLEYANSSFREIFGFPLDA
ncbi:MAG: PAS domain-containing protein, partial [Deltaproteobacteria bacterium]|nr:PAS domain-containing protein [Deltaproteobacteria bacterium]